MNGEVREKDFRRSAKQACAFAGHLRVRGASAEEKRGLAGLFPDRERSWIDKTLEGDLARALVVEIFEKSAWVPLGHAIIDTGGEMAVVLLPRFRGIGLCSSAIRAAAHNLRDHPLTALAATVDEGDCAAAGAFERAGFVPSGRDISGGRPRVRYTLALRDQCTPFNVWI